MLKGAKTQGARRIRVSRIPALGMWPDGRPCAGLTRVNGALQNGSGNLGMMQLHCDAILFDLDGVLVDSTRCVARHGEAWAAQHGLALDDVMRQAHGVRTIETMRRVAPGIDVEREAERFEAAELSDMQGVVAIEGALRLLQALPGHGWGIVTSGSRQLAEGRLKHAGLPVPGVVVGGDDVREGKPAPEPYLAGAARLGTAPKNCLAVEDAPAGVEAALAAGMQVIAVLTTHTREDLACEIIVERLASLGVEVRERTSMRLAVTID
jgi:sugar-phosphatase